ncbi:MAG: Histidine--tRNA ligase [Eubacteriales bacterium SKADARSKE-1]|nr:Histidine--tRNA ligase [Eubacteriales bacterium SKADARSKE-1]
MQLLTKAPRGTQDILPKDSYKWQFIENIMLNQAELFGFSEIRTPVFEHTELFSRSVGEDTDVVQKEMYTFNDKGGRSITLRPEGTAGAVRAMLEHGLYNESLPVKMSYITLCYRYEKPQSGRWREFTQFGVEMFGASSAAADAEVICLAKTLFDRLGLSNISLEINSIGCPKCRAKYYEALKKYFEGYKSELCETCLSRLDRNPMRILDCKSLICSKIAENAPAVLDFICADCKEHFEKLKEYLDAVSIEYTVNPKIVRGLDYYTRTVFEFVSKDKNTLGLVCGGGGRYDGLVEELGGKPTPALGFGLGIGRILLAMESQGIEIPKTNVCDVYIASIGDAASLFAFNLTRLLRESSFIAEYDTIGRGLKAQMKYADKIGAKFTLVLGDDEIASKKAKIKNMKTGDLLEINLDKNFLTEFFKIHAEAENEKIFKNFSQK